MSGMLTTCRLNDDSEGELKPPPRGRGYLSGRGLVGPPNLERSRQQGAATLARYTRIFQRNSENKWLRINADHVSWYSVARVLAMQDLYVIQA